MAEAMTTHERVRRVYAGEIPDRVPFWDSPWEHTVKRWQAEGLPEDVSWVDYFGLDHKRIIAVDNGPRLPTETLEETEDYVIRRNDWGATLKHFKTHNSTDEALDFTVKSRDVWERQIKPRIRPKEDRIPWDRLKRDYPAWRARGDWIAGHGWFTFDVIHSRMVGTERLLISLIDDSDWFVDMANHLLTLNLQLLDRVWEAGYTFDEFSFPDDLGYKLTQFMSLDMYRDLVKPYHKRVVEWAHRKGIVVYLHSCGDVRPFVPEFVELGIDCLNPLEVKAGMDPPTIKEQFGDRLVLHGGINAVLWTDTEAIERQIRGYLPKLKAGGRYIFGSDHSIPSAVSFEDFKRIVALYKELGGYD